MSEEDNLGIESKSIVGAVSIKLPPFWTDDPVAWFQAIEAQFNLRAITSEDTKYWHVLGSIDKDVHKKLKGDLTRISNSATKYTELKTKLTEEFDITDEERASSVLAMAGLGDRKPSELAMEIINLTEGKDLAFLLRHIYLQQLPENVRAPLAYRQDLSLTQLGKEADKIWAQCQNQLPIQSVDAEVDKILAKPRRHSSSKPRSLRNPNPSQPQDICWYHRTWKDQAQKCESHCRHFPKN